MSRAAPRWLTIPYNNDFAEPLWNRLKAELLEGGVFLSTEDAHTEIFDYIQAYYKRIKKHSSLGYKSPEQFEKKYFIRTCWGIDKDW